jgi:hypothetical protein
MPYRGSFQYQGFAEGPAPPTLPDLSWAPRYPERCPPRRGLAAAILAGALFFVPPMSLVTPATAAPVPAGSTTAALAYPVDQRQFISVVAPFQAALAPPAEDQTIDRWGQPPSQPIFLPNRLPSLLAGPVWTPQHQDAEGSALDWAPEYPDRIDRLSVRAADQLAFTTGQTGSTIPYTDLRWAPVYPDRIDRKLALPWLPWTALDAFPRPFFPQVVYADRVQGLPRLPIYPAFVLDPYPIPTVETATFVAAYYPDRLSRIVLPTLGGLFEPPFSVRDLGHIGWQGLYPDRIDRLSVRAADQLAFVQPRYLPINDLRWQGTFPDRLDRLSVRAADQQALFAPRYLPIADLRWSPTYPDRLWATARVVDYLAFTTGQTGSTIPYADLRWQGTFPSQIDRRLAQPHLWPSLVFWPFPLPNEPAPVLSWHPLFPDRLDRLVLPVALIPFIDVRNLDPIPNEGGQPVITIGVEIGITDFPVLGGWVPF